MARQLFRSLAIAGGDTGSLRHHGKFREQSVGQLAGDATQWIAGERQPARKPNVLRDGRREFVFRQRPGLTA